MWSAMVFCLKGLPRALVARSFVLQVWPDEPPPPDEGEDDLVCSTCTDVVAGLRFGDELTDQVGVTRGEPAVGKTMVDGVVLLMQWKRAV